MLSNSLSKLPFHPGQSPFKINHPPKAAGDPPQVSFTPRTKTKPRTIIKEFPKPTEDPQKFSEVFRVLIGDYDLGLPDLYQLVHMLVGPGEAQNCMQEAGWHNPTDDIRDP